MWARVCSTRTGSRALAPTTAMGPLLPHGSWAGARPPESEALDVNQNGKQFTARFGRGGEVLFDRICRDNAIVHRLTQPATPTTTGKIERFHQTLRRDLLDDHGPFADLDDVQATLDGWVASDYNTRRPHQSLDMASPADRFAPVPEGERQALPLRLPAALAAAPNPAPEPPKPERVLPLPPFASTPGAVEVDRVVPPSGNMWLEGRQFWLGPARAGSPSPSGPTATAST